MILLPAIDIKDGRAVRLERGAFDRQTVYADDPFDVARSFVEAGAEQMHIVDLDGAREGRPVNLHHLRRITRELDVVVQYGGGLRDTDAVRDALEAGATRVVVGTAAYTDPGFLEKAAETWNGRVIPAVDVRDGHVSVSGWTESTKMRPEEVIERLKTQRVTQFVYTNADRDGTLSGLDLDEVRRIGDLADGRFLYSGGISSLDDLRALKELKDRGLTYLAGVIVGKALYERRFTIEEAHAVLRGD
ncbi:MAG: 1-(5-phosphoribosyl)-5-[(5-phosphoribosylamino)methylideneamino]imidazole-4-carboxamide isomerase [Thermoleophilaceae bacterium]|nr:1-(5-phosphoribosyl)-5-[(5-phosphoribosylamino)methylideneamino]imidazole-4-carboxamide isomerase [Thermoleophilaceae bacterium]